MTDEQFIKLCKISTVNYIKERLEITVECKDVQIVDFRKTEKFTATAKTSEADGFSFMFKSIDENHTEMKVLHQLTYYIF